MPVDKQKHFPQEWNGLNDQASAQGLPSTPERFLTSLRIGITI